MGFDERIFCERFNEVKGADTQKAVAEKLHLDQSTISKILSGAQLPKIDTVYNIAEAYNVSVDWLLGLSRKRKYKDVTYAYVVKSFYELAIQDSAQFNRTSSDINVSIQDPLLRMLIVKGFNLYYTDWDLFDIWIEEKLPTYDLQIPNYMYWSKTQIDPGVIDDDYWLTAYNKVNQKRLDEEESINKRIEKRS